MKLLICSPYLEALCADWEEKGLNTSLPPNSKFKQQTEISSWAVSTSAIQKQVHHLLLGCWDLWRTERADTEALEAWSNTSLSFGLLGEVRTS